MTDNLLLKWLAAFCVLDCVSADVLCGGHRAETCALCPFSDGTINGAFYGAGWCNGECSWDAANNNCMTPSVLCSATGPAVETCDQCGRSETSCSGGDCVFNLATSFCRPHLTNDVRTASVHLSYPDPGNLVAGATSWWINRIEVVDSASVSYFASNGHRFGYGGLQQVTAPDADGSFVGKVLFSLWDQGCDQDANPNCDPNTLATVVSCGDGVTCEGFGGEGTGKKSWFHFNNWDTRADFYFVTHARSVSASRVHRMQYAGYFHSDISGWRHLATFEVNTGGTNWDLNGLYSFVEQWSPQETDQRRSALYGPGFVSDYVSATGCPSFAQLPSATFSHGTLENHMHVNAWADAGAVGIQTGGDIDPIASRGRSFSYPAADEPEALIDFKDRMACLISAAGGDATTCLASSWVGTCSPTPSPPSSPATPDVLCGGHRAETCALCPFSDGTINGANYGASWCNGDCIWDPFNNNCMTPPSSPPPPSPPLPSPVAITSTAFTSSPPPPSTFGSLLVEGTNTNLNGQYEFRPYSDLVLPTILNGQYNYTSSSGVWVRTDGSMVILQGDGGWIFCLASSNCWARQGYVGNNGGQPAESEVSDKDATRGPSTISYIRSPALPSPPPPPSPSSPSPPPPSPSPQPSPVAITSTAGGYYMIESGSCGSGLVSTTSECEDAATALHLSDQTAYDYTSGTYSSIPPGCQFASSRWLLVFGAGSTGSCSPSKQCICRATPP